MTEMFKIGILFGDKDDRPPEKIDPGFEFAEVPVSILLAPCRGQSAWEQNKALIESWKLPPIKVSSHFVGGGDLAVTGPNVDWELVEFWTRRAFARLGELGVGVVGVYGVFFPVPEGFSRTKAMDQALKFCDLLADEAGPRNMVIALEPMAKLETLWPRYLDGIAFAHETGRPEIKVMADMAYFLKLNQPFEDIATDPAMCVHVHVAGEGGQPGIGQRPHKEMFRVLRDIGYTGGVSCACPWVGEFGPATTGALNYLRQVREEVYAEVPVLA